MRLITKVSLLACSLPQLVLESDLEVLSLSVEVSEVLSWTAPASKQAPRCSHPALSTACL